MTTSPVSGSFASAINMAQNSSAAATSKITGSKADAAAHANAESFEATFLNSMFQNMFAGIDGEGPFGGTPGTGVWRSFMTDELAKSFAKNGGIGLADPIYRSLIAHQEVATKQ